VPVVGRLLGTFWMTVSGWPDSPTTVWIDTKSCIACCIAIAVI
jgi:hypothetical protein